MVRVQKDIFSYRTFNSDSFMRRAFAIWGHFIVAHLLMSGILEAAPFRARIPEHPKHERLP